MQERDKNNNQSKNTYQPISLDQFHEKQQSLSQDIALYFESQDLILTNSFQSAIQMKKEMLYECYFKSNDKILVQREGKISQILIKDLILQQNIKGSNSSKVLYINSSKFNKYSFRLQTIRIDNILNKYFYNIRLEYAINQKKQAIEFIIQSDQYLFIQKEFIQKALQIIEKKTKNKKIKIITIFQIKSEKIEEITAQILKISIKKYQKQKYQQFLYRIIPQMNKLQIQEPFITVNKIQIKSKQKKSYLSFIVHIDNEKGNINLQFTLFDKDTFKKFSDIKKAIWQHLENNYFQLEKSQNFEKYQYFTQKLKIIPKNQQLSQYFNQKSNYIYLMKKTIKKVIKLQQNRVKFYGNAILLDHQHINIKKDKIYQKIQLKNLQKDTIIDSRQFQPIKDIQTLLLASKINKISKTKYRDYIKITYNKINLKDKDIKTFVIYKHNYILYSKHKKAEEYQWSTALQLKHLISTKQQAQRYFLFSGSGKTYQIQQCTDLIYQSQCIQMSNELYKEQIDINNEIIIINDIKVLNKRILNHNIRIIFSREQSNKLDQELIMDFCYEDIFSDSLHNVVQNVVKDFKINVFHCVLYKNRTYSIQSKIQNIIGKSQLKDKTLYIFIISLPHLNQNRIGFPKQLNQDKQQDAFNPFKIKNNLFYIPEKIFYAKKNIRMYPKPLYLSSLEDEYIKKMKYYYYYTQKHLWQQFQQPLFKADKIIIWVDDNPDNNTYIIDQIKKDDTKNKIQIIQLQSTQSALQWINYFFKYFRWFMPNLQVKLITDMKRYEKDQAGAELLEEIVKLGLQIDLFIFTGNKQASQETIKKRKFQKNVIIKISQYQLQLKNWVSRSQFDYKTLYQPDQNDSKCQIM